MDLREHFDAKTAMLLEYAIQQHPDLAKAIHSKVVHGRDLPDRYVGIGKTDMGFGAVSGQYNRMIHGTPLPKVTSAPKPPKPPKPKPAPKPRGQTRPPMRELKHAKLPTPKPEPRPKPPERIKHPELRIDTYTHQNLTYITLAEAQKLVRNTPLANIGIYKDATAFAHYSAKVPLIRRLHLGIAAMTPTVLYEINDCQRVITARLNDIEPKTLTKHQNHIAYLERITYAGFEWMKVSEAMSIIAGITVQELHQAWINPNTRLHVKRGIYQWVYMQTRENRIPSLNVGEKKGAFVRTIDILPLAGTKRGVIP